MKSFYEELQMEIQDLDELENSITDSEKIKVIKEKKEEFFNNVIEKLEKMKNSYDKKDEYMTNELRKIYTAIKRVDIKPEDNLEYKENVVIPTIKMAKVLVDIRNKKENELKLLDDAINLIENIKNGNISTTEFGKEFEKYENALKYSENVMKYNPNLYGIMEELEKVEDNEEINILNKSIENKRNEFEQNNIKLPDMHPIIINGEEVYNSLGILEKYKLKKQAYQITEGKKPNILEKITLVFGNKIYSLDAKRYLSEGQINAGEYINKKNKGKEQVDHNQEETIENYRKDNDSMYTENTKKIEDNIKINNQILENIAINITEENKGEKIENTEQNINKEIKIQENDNIINIDE